MYRSVYVGFELESSVLKIDDRSKRGPVTLGRNTNG